MDAASSIKKCKYLIDYQQAAYNYAKYLNKNKTHALTLSTRFNATERLHLLGGLQFTHFETMQSKETPVYNGETGNPLSISSQH